MNQNKCVIACFECDRAIVVSKETDNYNLIHANGCSTTNVIRFDPLVIKE